MTYKTRIAALAAAAWACYGVSTHDASAQEAYSWSNLPKIQQPVFRKDTLRITAFGAVADGHTLNTKAINQAIESCSKKGGGVVLVPAGLWITGPVVLKSNVNLHLQEGSLLLFTTDKSQYAITEGFYEGKAAARNESPISGKDLENVAITGRGIVDGNGDVWRAVHKTQLTEPQWKEKIASGGVLKDDGKTWYPSEQFKKASIENKSMLLTGGKKPADFADIKDFLRPDLVVLNNCKKVLLEGVTFQNSAAWCLHPLMVQDLTIRNVRVKNPEYAHNGDGMDIESCKNFLIEGCVLDVGDDAICIKSGKDEEGRKRGIPTENGIIRNNIVYQGHGGFVVGSEMSGGARNIFVEQCTFMGTDKGLRFKSVRGRGGVVEKIYARNINMKDIKQEAIFFDLYYFVKFATDGERDMRPVVNEGTPVFKDMIFENIVCNGATKGVFVRGLPEMPVRNIVMNNMVLSAETGIELTDADKISFKNVKLITKHSKPVIFTDNATNISIDGLQYNDHAETLISVTGERSQNINIAHTDASKAKKVKEFSKGAQDKSLVIHEGK
ncbi:polygalacturonase [Dyadobacter sp. BE34]|uniref:Polygalacturonase n=1 Tax=Dyadobacter fermentans TaxID=94254 RepID=A0ABU1QY01_9BACT|nr:MULTISPECIES: glycoside hydrolase family 28 protein [Dyadobacter]MDR6805150.1 polygalacturonase [Dyadobacter fermentans]MDR7043091.1 polygalacturonase [Dyadobacter sp. BE242]MDR7197403.1 polygalacturonase [Dyadobacter sp. BE34]MDR7215164.1 polygalacturonase [Dyadobacter sp. BE31]MDR7262699.1 polygalacturonase [Dyadobacter sp. BE32]